MGGIIKGSGLGVKPRVKSLFSSFISLSMRDEIQDIRITEGFTEGAIEVPSLQKHLQLQTKGVLEE